MRVDVDETRRYHFSSRVHDHISLLMEELADCFDPVAIEADVCAVPDIARTVYDLPVLDQNAEKKGSPP